jgi:hypothetical protein
LKQRIKRICATALCWGWPLLRLQPASLQLTEIAHETNSVAIKWNAEAGKSYEVQSAPGVSGPWRSRATVEAASSLAQWVDTELASVPQQFYRVALVPNSSDGLAREGLFAGDFVSRNASLFGEQSGEIAANAVFLASQIGAGGARLVSTGTLTQQGQTWAYAGEPNDRLVVQFASGTNVDFYITRMQGDFSIDAANFLQSNHNFDYRVVISGVSDLSFTSDVASGASNFHATARGTLLSSNVTYTVDLTLSGLYSFEIDSTGSSLLNDYGTTGTIVAPGYSLTVNERRRFELISAVVNFGGATRTDTATSEQTWNNNTLIFGADTYQWTNAQKQKSFKNGKPSSVDTYWQASGGVLKNGAPFGLYKFETGSVFGYVNFDLVLPNEVIELESWNVQL